MHFSFIIPVVCCFCSSKRNDLSAGDLVIGTYRTCQNPICKMEYIISGIGLGEGGSRMIKTKPPDDEDW